MGVFAEGKLSFGVQIPDSGVTWAYNPHLLNKGVTYAKILAGGKNLIDTAPPEMMERWKFLEDRYKNVLRSLFQSKVDLSVGCIYDYFPEWLLLEYYSARNQIIQSVIDIVGGFDQSYHDHVVRSWALANKIRRQPLNFDTEALAAIGNKTCRSVLAGKRQNIRFNIFGSVTGRWTTDKWSFPIHNWPEKHRHVLKPRNDYFVELDYNSAELRTFFALSGREQPQMDIHRWNIENVFSDRSTPRSDAKRRMFAWFYGQKDDPELEKTYQRKKLLKKYSNRDIINPYGRKLRPERKDILNYLLQSTTSDVVLEKAAELDNSLSGMKSNIAFLMHDAAIIDCPASEIPQIGELARQFRRTRLGDWRIGVRIGTNYRDMRKIDV